MYKFTVCKYGLISSVNLKDFKKSEVSFPYSELSVDTTIWKNKVTQAKILILRSYEKTFVLQKNNYHDKKFKSIWRTIRNFGTMKSSKYVLLKLTQCTHWTRCIQNVHTTDGPGYQRVRYLRPQKSIGLNDKSSEKTFYTPLQRA